LEQQRSFNGKDGLDFGDGQESGTPAKSSLGWGGLSRDPPEWYPLFESHFLFGTFLGDFSLESCGIGLDHDFRIGEYSDFRSG